MDQSKSILGETDRKMKELNKGMNELDIRDEKSRELLQKSEQNNDSEINNLEQMGIKEDTNGEKEREQDESSGKDEQMNERSENKLVDDKTMPEGETEEHRNELKENGLINGQIGEFKDIKLNDGQMKMDESNNKRLSDEQMDKLMDEENSEWRVDEFGSMNLLDDTEYVLVTEEVSTAPIDRGWAWMAVVGCFGMYILAVGGIKCFGVLFVELEHLYDTTSKALASIQAIASTLMMVLSPVSNALSDKFGCRRVVFLGGVLLLVGFLASAFVPAYEWLYLTYGVIAGFGFGLSYAPCIVFVGHHFHKYRAFANGLSASGSGIGLFIFPPCMHIFIKWYGLSGALMLMAAFMFHICACAMLFRPMADYKTKVVKKWVPKSTLKDENEELLKNEVEIGEDCTENFVQNGIQITLPNDQETGKNTSSSILCCHRTQISLHSNTQCQKYINLLLNPVFEIFLFSILLATLAYPSVFIMVPSYAEEIKVDKQSGALMLSIIGITDVVGRIFFGWFSDRKLIPRKYEFMGTMGASGVLSLILPFVKTKVALFVYCGFYGFFAGAYISLIAVVLVDVLGLQNLSMGFGIVGLSMGLAMLGGPPIVGALRDISGTWDYSFMFAGLIAILGALIILLEPLAQKKIQRQSRQARLKDENKIA